MRWDRWRTGLNKRVVRANARLRGGFAPLTVRLRALEPGLWRSRSADPQIVFPTPPSGAREIIFYLEGQREHDISPRLYLDWGDGFNENDSVTLAGARAAIIRVRLGDFRGLHQLRLDPADGVSIFRFGFDLDGSNPALAAHAEQRLQLLETTDARVLRAEVDLVHFAPATRGRSEGAKRPMNTLHEQFLRVCALAADELGDSLGEPPEAPLISFVTPVYNTPTSYLDDLLGSFHDQPEGWAELVLSDDGSTSAETAAWLLEHADEPGLHVLRQAENRGIAAASNQGIAVARGVWVGLIDHDDALAPQAVGVIVRAIEENPDALFFFTDELICDKRLHGVDFFDKPAFDDILLSGVNYINHLSIYRRDRLEAIGGFRSGFDGSQDYDLLLRYHAGLKPGQALHLPFPAYMWRRDGASYSVKYLEKATANARRALGEAYGARDAPAKVGPAIIADLHRLRFEPATNDAPLVSIVIPNRNSLALMRRLLDGLLNATAYPRFEIIVVDNGSDDPEVLELYEQVGRERTEFRLDMEPATFSFSRQINKGVKLARGALILLLNNDIEVLDPDWLSEMVGCFRYPRVGIVGAKLLYPHGAIQHAGVIVGLGGLAGHWYSHRPADFAGPMARLAVRSSMSAVTGACMLVSRACFEAAGDFDEVNFAVAYNDIDFCLRARLAGFRTVYTPFATLVHHESATRGRDDRGPNRPRFLRDQASLLERHGTEDFEDPAYSPWHSRDHSEPSRILLHRLPRAR